MAAPVTQPTTKRVKPTFPTTTSTPSAEGNSQRTRHARSARGNKTQNQPTGLQQTKRNHPKARPHHGWASYLLPSVLRPSCFLVITLCLCCFTGRLAR